MTNLSPVTPGQPFDRSASVHNELLKVAREARQLKLNSHPVERPKWSPQDVLLIKNTSGEVIEKRYAIVGLDEPVFLPSLSANAEYTFREQTIFKCEWPATSTSAGRWGVLQQPLGTAEPNDVGIAIVSGTCVALVESSVVAGDSVDVTDSERLRDNVLQAASGGPATVLWTGEGFDEDLPANSKWAVIRFGGGGGGASIIGFSITEVDCDEEDEHGHHFATAEVTYVTCGLSSPEVGDEVTVYDLMGCFIEGNAALLIGRQGQAFKAAHETAYTSCDWVISQLCSADLECS